MLSFYHTIELLNFFFVGYHVVLSGKIEPCGLSKLFGSSRFCI